MRRSTFVLSTAAVAAIPSRAVAQTLAPLRIAIFPGDPSAQVYFSQDQGFFEKNGLEAQITEVRNGSAAASAVAGGSMDIGSSSPLSIMQGYERGVKFTIVAAAAESHVGTSTSSILISGKTSTVRTAKDLNGQIVASGSLGSFPQIAIRMWIDKNGGDSSTVKFVELPYSEMVAAVNSGRVAAAAINFAYDPLLGKPNDPAHFLGRANDAISTPFSSTVWFAMSDWANKNPDVARRFIATMKEAAVWGNSHPHETAVIDSKHTKQPVAEIEAAARQIYGTAILPEMLQPLIDSSVKYGALKRAFPAREIIYAAPVK